VASLHELQPAAQPDQIVAAARAMAAEGLVVGTVGNVSARVHGGFLITPTRTSYDSLTHKDLVFVRDGSDAAASTRAASREWPLHAAIYRARPDTRAIVHTHSVHATAWSFLDEPLGPATEELEYYATGPIRTSAPAKAGSDDLGDNAVAALGGSSAVLLGRHGVVAIGPAPDDALTIARVVEHQAHVAWLLRSAS
jgi:L-fuculose-phosphate aldolase